MTELQSVKEQRSVLQAENLQKDDQIQELLGKCEHDA
jgi:hypothetical protein